MALYSIRSERQFCEQLQYNLLLKWFLGMNVERPAFRPTGNTVALRRGAGRGSVRRLMSDEHFTVDGTLLESWASLKSLRPEPTWAGNANHVAAQEVGIRRSTYTARRAPTRPTSRLPIRKRGSRVRGTRWRPRFATR